VEARSQTAGAFGSAETNCLWWAKVWLNVSERVGSKRRGEA
jgi:hypothetical protein